MEIRSIILSYKKVINVASVSAWDKLVFEATYKEYYMQAQQFDCENRYVTFRELSEGVKNADQIHYLVSTSIAGYVKQLQGIIPDIANAFGKACLPFKNFKFEVVQSNRVSKEQHSVAITFYSDPVQWIDTIGNQLVISTKQIIIDEEIETDMISILPALSIQSLKYSTL